MLFLSFLGFTATGSAASLVISNINPSSYQVQYDNLYVGELEYIDRSYKFTGVPTSLEGSTYIKTANNDKYSTGSSFLTFDVNKDVIVYVAHDDRISSKPSWMSDFTDTGEHLTSSDSSNTFSLYSKEFAAGTVTLGGNYGGGGDSMYSVVVVPRNNPNCAWNPNPTDGDGGVSTSPTLSWWPGDGATSHDIYFGASQAAVAAAGRLLADINGDGPVNFLDVSVITDQWLTNPGGADPSANLNGDSDVNFVDFAIFANDWLQPPNSAFKGNQPLANNTYNPPTLAENTIYYWRIDEVSGSSPDSPHTGNTWSFTTEGAASHEIVFPGATWQFKSPAELGLDEAKLNQFVSSIGGVGCIVRQGYMVKTWGTQSSKADWASAAKPVVSTMLFFAVKEALLTSVNEKIEDHGWDLITKDEPMEFYHLANMTSGYARGEAPGAAWAYNDYAIQLYVKTLFDNVYGTTANTAATHANRLGALGFQDGSIFSSRGGYGLSTSPRDFARIGWLWCNKGYWNGTQLLPRHYFDDYMKAHVPAGLPRTTISGTDYLVVGTYGGDSDQTADGPGVYGFNWWHNPNKSNWPDAPGDTVQANGHDGQETLTLIPSLSLVVACRGNNGSHTTGTNSTMNQNLKLLTDACPPVPTGSIIVDPANPAWFKYNNGGPFFLCGSGDPEDFLYRGTRNPDGTRNGDQMTLINKLIGTGCNGIYLMALRSHGGDGQADHNPFIDSDKNNPLDEDILDQWETWFTAMDDNGIVIDFFFYDDDADPFGKGLPAGGELDPREANFIDTLVARFKHHRHLIWCVAEEYAEGFTYAHASKFAERIKQQDDNNHPVKIHQWNGLSFDFNGNDNLDSFGVQCSANSPAQLHSSTLQAWNNVGGLVNINMCEWSPIPTGADFRRSVWAIAMGGGYSMTYTWDIISTPIEDLESCGRLVGFMESTKFNETQPYDSLARGDTDYVLADPGSVYIVYGDSGSSLGVNIQAGTYRVKWYDPVDGDWVDEGVQSLSSGDKSFTKPAGISDEAVLYLATSG